MARRVRIAKGSSSFCYPEHISVEMNKLFAWLKLNTFLRGLEAEAFAKAASHFLSELNAIHPFRDGNGRSQLAFMALLSAQAGHGFHVHKIKRKLFLEAMITSFNGDEEPLREEIAKLIS
jgi:cell filamentation protein